MSMKDLTLIEGPSITVENPGITPVFTLGNDGVQVQSGNHFVFKEDTEYETRRQVTIKHRPATYDSKTGVYGKDKKSISIVAPQVLTDGRIVFNTIRIEREVHPTLNAEGGTRLRTFAAQMLLNSDVGDFWTTGDIN